MVLQKLPRNAAMDSIDLYRRLDSPNGEQVVADSGRIDAVLAELRGHLLKELASEPTLRGWRTQSLFASLIAALDECDLMTFVDTGEIYFDGPSVKAPDYFLHLRSGRRILVDVKTEEIKGEDILKHLVKFGAAEVQRMRRYGDLFGAEVFLAIYLPMMSIWSLVSLDDLVEGPGGGKRIAVGDCIKRSQMALLGDRQIGTVYPLEYIVRPDQSKPQTMADNGELVFTVGSEEFYAGGELLVCESTKRLAYFLMRYGNWKVEPKSIFERGELVEISLTAGPIEESEHGFAMTGSLASMYSQLFESKTTGSAGVTALDIKVQPGMLVSLVPHDYDSDELPLWRFKMETTPAPAV